MCNIFENGVNTNILSRFSAERRACGRSRWTRTRWTRDCGHARPPWPNGEFEFCDIQLTITCLSIPFRLWTDPIEDREVDVVPKQVFNRFSVFRSRLVDLGLKAEPIFPKFCAQNQNECV